MKSLDFAKMTAGRVAASIEAERCAYVYPGNHKRCERSESEHSGVPGAPRGNVTADGHGFVEPE